MPWRAGTGAGGGGPRPAQAQLESIASCVSRSRYCLPSAFPDVIRPGSRHEGCGRQSCVGGEALGMGLGLTDGLLGVRMGEGREREIEPSGNSLHSFSGGLLYY
ncbi:hypothetical protein LIA77_05988 [Sarocladium implicatum]|nr:hypothetical protein LIA77_05988 [Sarocladium implicatum]